MVKIILVIILVDLCRRVLDYFGSIYILSKTKKMQEYQENYWSEHYHSKFGTPENWNKTRGKLL